MAKNLISVFHVNFRVLFWTRKIYHERIVIIIVVIILLIYRSTTDQHWPHDQLVGHPWLRGFQITV